MSVTLISVENLSKRYLVGHEGPQDRYHSLRDAIVRQGKNFLRKTVDMARGNQIIQGDTVEEFWALKDVSFEVKRGEVLGIIGRNGAGKSTLLKILSRITEPTSGRVTLNGRVASLLEVGTGFHPELTGRENIFLNGAILGMGREEIRKKFDEIVAFAEVENFLDTPVKRYSSGMYVRLAFAVAAHLEQEILIVDEVLAVGDAQFQKKCLGKMGQVAKGGRTVIFVSHDMRKVSALCDRGILLKAGQIESVGGMTEVAGIYLQGKTENNGFADLSGRGDRSGNGAARFGAIELLKGHKRCTTFEFGESFTQRVSVTVNEKHGVALIAILINSSEGIPIHELWNVNADCRWKAEKGDHEFMITIPKLCLYPGTYSIDVWMGNESSGRVDYMTEVIKFNVVQTTDSGLARPLDRSNGLVFQQSEWAYEKL